MLHCITKNVTPKNTIKNLKKKIKTPNDLVLVSNSSLKKFNEPPLTSPKPSNSPKFY